MATVQKHRYSITEYLAFDDGSDIKHQFLNGEIFAMTGASPTHNLLVGNLVRELGNRLKQRPCLVYPSDLRLRVERTGLHTYPDVTVCCGTPRFDGNTVLNPLLIVEVLSESTEAYDRGKKFAHYRQIESLRQYLLVNQDARMAELFTWRDDGEWLLEVFDSPDDVISLTSLDCELPLTEIYDKVDLA